MEFIPAGYLYAAAHSLCTNAYGRQPNQTAIKNKCIWNVTDSSAADKYGEEIVSISQISQIQTKLTSWSIQENV